LLKQRVITAVILAAFVLWALFFWPSQWFALFLVVTSAACAWEWSRLGNLQSAGYRIGYTIVVALVSAVVVGGVISAGSTPLKLLVPPALVAWVAILFDLRRRPVISLAATTPNWALLAVAAFLLVTAVASLYLALIERSALYFIYIIVIVAAADIGAYFVGKRFGKRKLAVEISQGKTIEGAIGGMLAATLLTMTVLVVAPALTQNVFTDGGVLFAMSLLAAVFSVVGDLFISRAKRSVGVKDSSNLLPGHGGVLDRFDGLLAAAPFLVVPLLGLL
jgi:phosphatidate cytidylyltransferase